MTPIISWLRFVPTVTFSTFSAIPLIVKKLADVTKTFKMLQLSSNSNVNSCSGELIYTMKASDDRSGLNESLPTPSSANRFSRKSSFDSIRSFVVSHQRVLYMLFVTMLWIILIVWITWMVSV